MPGAVLDTLMAITSLYLPKSLMRRWHYLHLNGKHACAQRG